MKGLLLKDFYMARKYCRSYLLIAAIFLAVSLAGKENMFLVFYPCLLCGMIPVNLLAYDERSRWLQYSAVLPYTRAQLVSAKYLIGLLAQLAVLLATGIVQAVRMHLNGSFRPDDYIILMLLVLIISTVTSSISLPFMFRLGVEKGRIAYLVMIATVCAASVAASSLYSANLQAEIPLNGILPSLSAAGIGIYALSWYLSVVFYRKRDIY